jgi:hypothetical protein
LGILEDNVRLVDKTIDNVTCMMIAWMQILKSPFVLNGLGISENIRVVRSPLSEDNPRFGQKVQHGAYG